MRLLLSHDAGEWGPTVFTSADRQLPPRPSWRRRELPPRVLLTIPTPSALFLGDSSNPLRSFPRRLLERACVCALLAINCLQTTRFQSLFTFGVHGRPLLHPDFHYFPDRSPEFSVCFLLFRETVRVPKKLRVLTVCPSCVRLQLDQWVLPLLTLNP